MNTDDIDENEYDDGTYTDDYDMYEGVCYECTGYGDDYYTDESGEQVCRCFECPNFYGDDDLWDD